MDEKEKSITDNLPEDAFEETVVSSGVGKAKPVIQDPYKSGCTDIEETIYAWYENGMEFGIEKVLDTLALCAHTGVRVIVPVNIDDKRMKAPGGVVIEKDDNLQLQHIMGPNNDQWLPLFTSKDEMDKGMPTASMAVELKAALGIALSDKSVSGVVVNPWDKALTVPKEVVEIILATDPNDITEDMQLLNDGADAYSEGDYDTAFELYTKSADMGNITAFSNLGYCYYYGRGTEVDKEKAKECWEKAAMSGDICATYKLGDMYRNGDLPENMERAKAMYKTAFKLAQNDMDIYSYPDAALRVMKYCSEDFEKEELLEISNMAIEAMKLRVEDGDKNADEVYKEVQLTLAELALS